MFLSENPLSCSCDSQELWEWLRDHQKLVERTNTLELRCEHPPELRGRVFLDLDPEQFCDQPMVVKLGIQDIQPFSVLVSWQSRNHSGLHGYQVAYYSMDTVDEVCVLYSKFMCLTNSITMLRSNIQHCNCAPKQNYNFITNN